jgi:hypothetical protein
MGVSFLANEVMTILLKRTFQRTRPFEAYPELIFKKGTGWKLFHAIGAHLISIFYSYFT